MVRNWVSFSLSPKILTFLPDDIIKVVICATFVFKDCSRCCKVWAHLYHSGKSSSSSPKLLAFPATFQSRLELSLRSVCVRRKDSLYHKGEFLLSTSNLDTQPLLFRADSHRPCQKSIHYCCTSLFCEVPVKYMKTTCIEWACVLSG